MQFFKNVCLIITNFLLNLHKASLKKSDKNGNNYIKERKLVADIIMDVLVEKICVREALLKFPKNCEDKAVSVAWHALLHFEADEDLAKSDILFKETQVNFLEGLYNILSQGHDLPENLIRGYNKYHDGVDTCQVSRREYFWHEMRKNLNIYD